MNMHASPQLGFDTLLDTAETANRAYQFKRQTAHLPDTKQEAIPFYRLLLKQHHAAMMAADVDKVMSLREEAHLLALHLNDGEPGILAHDDAPGCVLERRCAATPGDVPVWGQRGEFIITVKSCRIRITLDGIFGIGGTAFFWPGFAAHAVDSDKPFLTATGYRSFLGIHAEAVPDLTPDIFSARVIGAYLEKECTGKLVAISPRYRERLRDEAA